MFYYHIEKSSWFQVKSCLGNYNLEPVTFNVCDTLDLFLGYLYIRHWYDNQTKYGKNVTSIAVCD